RLDADHSFHTMDRDIWVSNGVAFSPEGRTMYFSDSHIKQIYSYELDPTTGALANKRVFSDASDRIGIPDGATVDADGLVWQAEFDFHMSSNTSYVVRRDPNGRIERAIEVPVSRPTSCMFGGPDLDILYVTTASFRMSEAQKAAQPMAGGLLALDVGVRGVPESRFGG
ncbi:MAG: SMP-30/gluconolactonase/LRE family protein, partial [Proteobacteria bacterium]|nr:SMP-30/gluconolactonase/LRE family protein [Pseudomonadota bacterium]